MSARRAVSDASDELTPSAVSGARRGSNDSGARRAVSEEQSTVEAVTDQPRRCVEEKTVDADLVNSATVTVKKNKRALEPKEPEKPAPSRSLDAVVLPDFEEPSSQAVTKFARRSLAEDELLETTLVETRSAFEAEEKRTLTRTKLLVAAGIVAVLGPLGGISVSHLIDHSGPVNAAAAETSGDSAARDSENISRSATRAAEGSYQMAKTQQDSEDSASSPKRALDTEVDFAVDENIAPGQIAPSSTEEALAKAKSMSDGSHSFSNLCLALVATFYGYNSSGSPGAQQAAERIIEDGQMHTDMENIPVGALVWYDGTPIGNPYGHVAMYAGDGMVYSNGAKTGVGLIPLEEPADDWGEPIIGWSSVWLPNATR